VGELASLISFFQEVFERLFEADEFLLESEFIQREQLVCQSFDRLAAIGLGVHAQIASDNGFLVVEAHLDRDT
jgi:hypothetical protein